MQIWTEAEIQRLIELRDKGFSARKIAKEMGSRFTKNSVIGKLHRIGLKLSDVGYSHTDRIRKGVARYKKTRDRIAKKKPKFPVYPMPIETDTPTEQAVVFADLEDHHCRYMFGSGLSALYCGQEKTLGSSFCVHHHIKCYREG